MIYKSKICPKYLEEGCDPNIMDDECFQNGYYNCPLYQEFMETRLKNEIRKKKMVG
jgi:hypothetical protein